MRLSLLDRRVRGLWHRGFAKAELELEFQRSFQSYGVRFLYLSTLIGALAFVAFWLTDAVTGKRLPTDETQVLRMTLIAVLLGFGQLTRVAKNWFTRTYWQTCAVIVLATAAATSYLAINSQRQGTAAEMYWAVTTAMVFTTLLMYGCARLKPGVTVLLGVGITGVALWFSMGAPKFDATGFQRMTIHLVSANVLGMLLYRFSLLRERKLFLQSKRKNHIAELRKMKEMAEAASRAKTTFLANMSHEIRTPMNGVIGALSMLSDQNLSERDRLFVKSARDSARNLLHILNEILDFAKLDAQKIKLTPLPFDPRDLVCSVSQAFQATAEQKGIRIRSECRTQPPELCTLTADEGKLRQVMLNLVSNAVKFTQSGEVVVSLSARPLGESLARVTLDISDTGVGIPPESLDSLFQPFFQVESGNNRSHGGTGLGLAICKQIVDEMGGTISVRSVLGIGTTFEVVLELPYSCEDLRATQDTATDHGFADSLPPDLTDLRLQGDVLLVEDNEVNAFIATMTLESLGVNCRHAKNGEVAVELFRQQAFDVVLMDCEMPVMDGYEAVRLIRALEAEDTARERTPIIALTAHALSGDREACLAHGMDDYLTKPFDRQDLAGVLARWLPVVTPSSAR